MTGKRNDEQELGIMLIDFNPVVREGLQAILAKDEHLVVTGDVPDGPEVSCTSNVRVSGEIRFMWS